MADRRNANDIVSMKINYSSDNKPKEMTKFYDSLEVIQEYIFDKYEAIAPKLTEEEGYINARDELLYYLSSTKPLVPGKLNLKDEFDEKTIDKIQDSLQKIPKGFLKKHFVQLSKIDKEELTIKTNKIPFNKIKEMLKEITEEINMMTKAMQFLEVNYDGENKYKDFFQDSVKIALNYPKILGVDIPPVENSCYDFVTSKDGIVVQILGDSKYINDFKELIGNISTTFKSIRDHIFELEKLECSLDDLEQEEDFDRCMMEKRTRKSNKSTYNNSLLAYFKSGGKIDDMVHSYELKDDKLVVYASSRNYVERLLKRIKREKE